MQRVRVPISSFQFGEISDSLRMRTDTPIYAASAERLENMVVMTEGSVKKRTGLKFFMTTVLLTTLQTQSSLICFLLCLMRMKNI